MDQVSGVLCPVCQGGSRFGRFRYGLVTCESCGVVLSPAVWQASMNQQMEDEWFGEGYQPDASLLVRRFEEWNNRRTLARLSRCSLPGNRLLEIGVGSGSFLMAAKARGFNVMGCDLSRPICRRVESAYGIPMHFGTLESLEGADRFDVVVLNHVLEHVQKPVDLLRAVGRVLNPGGVVHIAVPNVASWEARLAGWTSYEPYHLIYFDSQTLTQTVKAAGLSSVEMLTHDSFSGWFLAVLRTCLGINRADGAVVSRPNVASTSEPDSRRMVRIKDGYRLTMLLFGAVLWPVRYVQAKLGYGDEAVCLACKPIVEAGG